MKLFIHLGVAFAVALAAATIACQAGAFRTEAAGDIALALWAPLAALVLGAHAYAFCDRKAEECRAADREEEEREHELKLARLRAGLPEAQEIED